MAAVVQLTLAQLKPNKPATKAQAVSAQSTRSPPATPAPTTAVSSHVPLACPAGP